jgi:hypothetical protein
VSRKRRSLTWIFDKRKGIACKQSTTEVVAMSQAAVCVTAQTTWARKHKKQSGHQADHWYASEKNEKIAKIAFFLYFLPKILS